MRTDLHSHHIEIDGRIWEINIPERKALLRSQASLTDNQQKTVTPVSEDIEEYIKILGFGYFRKVRDTKFVFSEFPLCNWTERNIRPDNPDAYSVCVELAVLKTDMGYRCPKHLHS